MKYKIAICDDEQEQMEYITSIVTSWSAHEGHPCEIHTFASAEAFLFEYAEDKAYDILLLDVEMKNMNGIELAKRIRRDNNRAEIIFITSHFEFAGDVLTGLIAALLAQGMRTEFAAIVAPYIHGLAGEIAAQKYGVYSVTATDVADCIGAAIKSITE